jgi:hypothetical protein
VGVKVPPGWKGVLVAVFRRLSFPAGGRAWQALRLTRARSSAVQKAGERKANHVFFMGEF